jgi:hypothetical protein
MLKSASEKQPGREFIPLITLAIELGVEDGPAAVVEHVESNLFLALERVDIAAMHTEDLPAPLAHWQVVEFPGEHHHRNVVYNPMRVQL